MRTFGTRGPVNPEQNYVVQRTDEISDFINRVKDGRYIVIFAPRQTGKTTFFRLATDALTLKEPNCFIIQLNFERRENLSPKDFYNTLCDDVCEEIKKVFQKRGNAPSEKLTHFLENVKITDNVSMRNFYKNLDSFLENQQLIIFIDEFHGIPQAVENSFLASLRAIYISRYKRCPHSVSFGSLQWKVQRDSANAVSPFNVQDDFVLSNFSLEEVKELLGQYTDEVGQPFSPEVIKAIHKQTEGQPFLVNRFAQILTQELDIPKTEAITMEHFAKASF